MRPAEWSLVVSAGRVTIEHQVDENLAKFAALYVWDCVLLHEWPPRAQQTAPCTQALPPRYPYRKYRNLEHYGNEPARIEDADQFVSYWGLDFDLLAGETSARLI